MRVNYLFQYDRRQRSVGQSTPAPCADGFAAAGVQRCSWKVEAGAEGQAQGGEGDGTAVLPAHMKQQWLQGAAQEEVPDGEQAL